MSSSASANAWWADLSIYCNVNLRKLLSALKSHIKSHIRVMMETSLFTGVKVCVDPLQFSKIVRVKA